MGDRTAEQPISPPTDVIVVGASAGGVEALREFVGGLPSDLSAAVLVVLHMAPHAFSALPAILGRVGPLSVVRATDGKPLTAGTIYVAIPDHHLLVTRHRILLSHGPTENHHRPGVDALFRSAAMTWTPRVAGVVLSGSLDDGTAGAVLIKSRGGLVGVQAPEDALYPGMPQSVLARVPVDFVLPAAELAAAVAKSLRSRPDPAHRPHTELDELETRIDAGSEPDARELTQLTEPSGLSCPDCGGVLFTLPGGERFRCRVGHAWTVEALLMEKNMQTEQALWAGLRALREKQQLAEKMSVDALRRGDEELARRFADHGAEQASAIETLQKLLVGHNGG
ncbi:chemotaxis protein CheB [Nocardia arthritidis]|uniref:protein-glutamate methylesterase n=1 Tax=Nocardia arthritidis TaxID=228602 RepID=A0A6G9Y9C0_9NOCA|nr:chemotaxis protein CheB [Nocardia arthritidis]QIS09643.1 chemotaxis protein CheB [Nocardia arthritidis]